MIERAARGKITTSLLAALLLVLAGCESSTESTATEIAEQIQPSPTSTSGPGEPTATNASDPTSTEAPAPTEEPTATVAPPTNTALPPPTQPDPTAASEPPPTPTDTPVPEPERTEVIVLDVTDGDTIRVLLNGQDVAVRLIGVDTPETVDPNEPVMCFGPEATAFTREMVERADNRVLLEQDVSDTDSRGRLLRYVWLPHPDGTRSLNEELVKQGYAQAATFPPDVKYADLFARQTREAREAGRGLWGSCGDFGIPAAPATSPPAPPPPPSANCDPSYPDVCIPPYPPDLDCGEIPDRRFRVTGSDPHGFDRDNDGIGCES